MKKKEEKNSINQQEEKILKYWKKNKIFQQSIESRSEDKRFIFYEGPPTANGMPGIHHVLARAFKDLIPRYKTMQGFRVERKAGWDTHGLPVELQVEKELNISGKPAIEKFGIEEFNNRCKESVWHYKDEWEKLTERIGFWVDMEKPYVTYENGYIESVWNIIQKIDEKGLLYKDYKVVPYCPRCGTSLSSHEVAQGYKKIKEPSVYVKFKIKNEENAYILAWTTTPWTLPGNIALAVGEDIDYIKVRLAGDFYYLAKARKTILEDGFEIVGELKGRNLVGKAYEPLFPYLINQKDDQAGWENAYRVYAAGFVTIDDGTGVVHISTMYGDDDFKLGRQVGLPRLHTVDEQGRFKDFVEPWKGIFVKEADPKIIEKLKYQGRLFKTESYEHDYPFCWRCDTHLLYYAYTSWFIRMPAVRDKLIENNQNINWVPDHIKNGRFGEWLNEVKDWALSRNRFWGTPLPVWLCEKCQAKKVIGSIKELGLKNKKNLDLHRPFIDGITIDCQCGGVMRRVEEVIDCWFDSGSMPFAQWHYPMENKELIDNAVFFPADYICEAIDQTRGWFYTLLAISTALDKGASYKNVICLGHINDAKGKKMSKSKGNVVDPWEVIGEYGADALRWHLYSINHPGEPKNFDINNVRDVYRNVIMTLSNVFSFYQLYAKGFKKDENYVSQDVMDRWIMARLMNLIKEVTESLDDYNAFRSSRSISDFISDLSTWYLRRSRNRFKSDVPTDKSNAQNTAYYVISELLKLMAPFAPFVSERLYLELNPERESVHLEHWPKIEERRIDDNLLNKMEVARQVAELVLAVRKEHQIKVRQPLSLLEISAETTKLPKEILQILEEELNIKDAREVDQISEGENWAAKEYGNIRVAVNINISDDLRKEGLLRELVRNINSLRKEAELSIEDSVDVYYDTDDKEIKKMFTKKEEYLKSNTLSVKFINEKIEDGKGSQKEFKIEGKNLWLGIK